MKSPDYRPDQVHIEYDLFIDPTSRYRMKLFHGTLKERAEKIKEEGFKITDESNEMALGIGVYFSRSLEDASYYASDKDWRYRLVDEENAVIEVEIPDDIEICEAINYQGIGTFYQNYDSWCKRQIISEIAEKQGVDDIWSADYSEDEVEDKCFELYREDAKAFRDDYYKGGEGCEMLCTPTQCVLYDKEVAEQLKGDEITIHDV